MTVPVPDSVLLVVLILFGKASDKIPQSEELVTEARRLTSNLGLTFDLGKVAERLVIACPES